MSNVPFKNRSNVAWAEGKAMDHQGRLKRAHELVVALDLPRPLTPELLHAHMEGVRKKKIVIREGRETMLNVGVCGLWIEVAGEGFERIHHAPTISAVHRQQLINHEYGHMILSDEKELLSADQVARFAPLIPYDAIVHALFRSSLTDELEALAEAIGDMLALAMLSDRAEARDGARTGFGRVL
jgi:hypothetical protein